VTVLVSTLAGNITRADVRRIFDDRRRARAVRWLVDATAARSYDAPALVLGIALLGDAAKAGGHALERLAAVAGGSVVRMGVAAARMAVATTHPRLRLELFPARPEAMRWLITEGNGRA
jgi:hypothetical protein